MREARTRALARLELEQVGVCIGGDATQLIEFRIVTGGDHITVADHRRGFGGDGTGQQLELVLVHRDGLLELLQPQCTLRFQRRTQRGQGRDGEAQTGEIARSRRAQRDAREDPFYVADRPQRRACSFVRAVCE